MFNWFKTKTGPKLPTLSDMYWYKQPSLIRDSVGIYDELPLGWIYSGLHSTDKSYTPSNVTSRMGKGWYRHNLGIL